MAANIGAHPAPSGGGAQIEDTVLVGKNLLSDDASTSNKACLLKKAVFQT
jgi:hypothetical protein